MYLSSFIVILIFSLASLFVKKEPMREMKGKFESGIDQNEQDLPPFYMHFFYVGILFLVFDVEIVLAIPIIQSTMMEISWMIYWCCFISIIFLGLIVEVFSGSTDWKE